MNARQALDALKRQYPRPEPNAEWVSHCLDSLTAEGRDATYENVLADYLDSDLAETTLRGVMPQGEDEAALHDAALFPQPTLVQLHSITEIGASAFALNTAREQRREVLSGATRIRGIDDDDEDEDDIDGKLPSYPRSMLSMEVSDGRTALRAIEYRRLEELELGETRLGLKFLLHNVKILRGVLLLEPKNCTVVGGCVDALEDGQPQAFIDGLQKRLHDAKENPVKMTQPKRGRGSRRTTVTRGTTSAPTRVVSARPATSTTAPRAPTSASGSAARAAAIRAALQNADLPEEPRREAPPVARTTRATAVASSATAAPSSGSYANPTVISDDEDEFGDLDDSFIQAIDEAEVVAAAASRSRTQSQTPAPPRTQQRSSGRTVIPADAEVIELIDSD